MDEDLDSFGLDEIQLHPSTENLESKFNAEWENEVQIWSIIDSQMCVNDIISA